MFNLAERLDLKLSTMVETDKSVQKTTMPFFVLIDLVQNQGHF